MMLPPDARILTAPVGGGKTGAALNAILELRLFRAFAPVWVLLASGQQEQDFRARLLALSPDSPLFGIEYFTLDSLYARVLTLLGDPQRRIGDSARLGLLRRVIADLDVEGKLAHFGPIARTPGFVGLVAGLIHELKQGLVEPEQFTQAAARRGPKDRDLAQVYARYQALLQDQRLVDRHGAGWLAVHHLEGGQQLPAHARPELLIVDGFDQFNAVSRRFLAALARQLPQTLITLTAVPPASGRRFHRFEHTLARLLESSAADGSPLWRVEPLPTPPAAQRPPVLAHLVDQVFRSAPHPIPGDESLLLVEAPDPLREVAAALRGVKRLLLAGADPESVLIVAREIAPYADALRTTARAYGLPLIVRDGLPLRENPAVAALIGLLDLAAHDFPRRDLIDLLQSPYLVSPDLTPAQIAQIERVSRAAQVMRGRDQWLEAIAAAGLPGLDEDAESGPLLPPDEARALAEALARHLDRITPPAQATVEQFVAWIADRLLPDPADEDETAPSPGEQSPAPQTFSVLANIRAAADADRVVRDVRAFGRLREVLVGLRAAHDLLAAGRPLPVLSWAEFRAELELALRDATLEPEGGSNRLGRVLAISAGGARGLPHDHVIVMGLSEGVFPQLEADDALYSEAERADLERGEPPIEMLTYAERADDMSRFYQVIGLARRSLMLTRFTVDERGTEVPASPYWNAVCAAVDVPPAQQIRLAVGAAPSLDEAATLEEAAIALAAALSSERPGEPPEQSQPDLWHGVHAALSRSADGARSPWTNARRGRALEAAREDPARPPDRWLGLLNDPALVAEAARRLGPGRLWSASQFDEYGACPYRFFARRMLRLEELVEPEEGPDVLQTGSLNHAILEAAYAQIAAEGLHITPENAPRALAILDAVAAPLLDSAPRRYGFRASPVWAYQQANLLDRLRALVAQDFSDESPFRLPRTEKDARHHPLAAQIAGEPRVPFLQEAAFGFDDRPPLTLEGDAGTLRVRGQIDRMDLAGDQVIVIDYKTGTTKRDVEGMAEGREFQMAIYLLAARALLPRDLTLAGGVFWHIRSRTTSGEVLATDDAVERAHRWMHHHVQQARAGDFAVRPAQPHKPPCARGCEFRALCRYARPYSRKPPAGLDSTQS